MVLLSLLVGVLLVVGGIINYIYAAIKKSSGFWVGFYIAFFIDSIVVLVLNFLLLVSPQFIYTYIHWGWILGINIGMAVGAIAMMIIHLYMYYDGGLETDKAMGVLQFCVGAFSIVFMIFGLSFSDKFTYEISKAEDFRILANLPDKERIYNVKLVGDIDFSNYDATKGFGDGEKCIILDGQGYSIKNIQYTRKLTTKETVLFNLDGHYQIGEKEVCSQIKNLTVENCGFILTPDLYNKETHEGLDTEFYIFSMEETAFSNFKITSTTVTVMPAVEDVRNDTPSTLEEIYPTKLIEKFPNCTVDMNVVYMD